MGKTISQLTELLSGSISNTENILIGVDNSGDATSYKLKLSELHKVPPSEIQTFVDGDTTPSVEGTIDGRYITANTTPTTITNFDDPTEGETIVVYINDSNTVIANNASIELDTGANFNPAGNALIELIYISSVWHEKTRATY